MQTRALAIVVAATAIGFACGSSDQVSPDACPNPTVDAGAVDERDDLPDTGADPTGDAGGTADGSADGGPTPAVPCVGCTRTAFGAPTWEPTGIVLFTGRIGQFAEDYNPLMQSLLAPRHQFYGAVNQFGPAVAHPPPYDGEIFELLAARGITPSQTFTNQEFTTPNAVLMTMTIVPSSGAAVASSFDFVSGPVISNLQFPITVDADLYRNGQLYNPAFDSVYLGYSQFSPPIAVSGSNPPVPAQGTSHLFVSLPVRPGPGPQPPPTPADGVYEYRVKATDATGAGWNVTVPFKVGTGGTPSTGIPLVADADGRFDGTNPAGVVGHWWSTGDAFAMDGTPGGGTCPAAGFPPSACSVLTTPAPAMPFRPEPNGKGMCTSGTSAQVVAGSDGMLAWSSIWGNMIGVDLNNPNAGPLSLSVAPYDAVAHGITGFAFDIDAVPLGGQMRVAFATTGTEMNAPYWSGATTNLSPVLAPGHYEMRWPEIGGPMYLGPSAPPFDPKQLKWISFHMVSNNGFAVPYSYCLSNVMLLTN